MFTGFGPNNRCASIVCMLALSLFALSAANVRGQNVARSNSVERQAVASESSERTSDSPAEVKKPATTEEKLSALEQMLEQQSQRLDQLQQTIVAQQETIRLLASKLSSGGSPAMSPATNVAIATQPAQPPTVEDRLKKVEGRVAEIGAIKFSGDLRLRAESIFGQSNSLANGDNPAVLGNELTPRHRMRLRARLQMRGSIGDEFDWGLRLATGSFADNITTNQTLTDFFNRKPFALDQAFITYKPKRAPGLRLQGGKFEPPWTYTEMTIDNDLMVEGFNESYSRAFKKSTLKDLTFVAWQLPFLERNSAFVRNSNGTVNLDQSRRGGRDLALENGGDHLVGDQDVVIGPAERLLLEDSDEVPQDLLRDQDPALDAADLRRRDVEVDQEIARLAEVLDVVREATLAPR